MRIAVNKVHHPVTALGPGRRVGIWLQGCSVHCPGCLSLDTWDTDPARETTVAELIAGLPAEDVDGFTISGGEPFDQPEALAELLRELRRRWPGADLLAYSGYRLARLQRRHPDVLALLDAVIAEPFRRDQPTTLLWRGSANQRLVPLSALGRERYAPYLDAEGAPMQVAVDESIWYVGVPRSGDLERLDAMLAAAGVHQEQVTWRS
jgi:anaerobic ribonucleoside-triphosphate reductase activating protein